MGKHLDVFISSTSIDLPEHRQAVVDALLDIGLFPSGMEHWPVEDEYPVDLCREKVEEAELFIGIYAHRYGWRPDGPGTPSITEMEYDWAEDIPRFCFLIDPSHPWPPDQIEGDAATDLKAFKDRVSERIRGTFTTPDDLKAKVLAAMAPHAQKSDTSQVLPYLRHLHHEAMQSGLLKAIDPSTKDPSFGGKHITVNDVYTPLDTRTQVVRDEEGLIRWDMHEAIVDRMHDRAKERDDETKPSSLSAMEAASHYSHLVVLGDPGSGKSTFVNFLALGLAGHWTEADNGWLEHLQDQGWEHDALLPVRVILRDFAQDMGETATHGTAQSLMGHIERMLGRCDCPGAITAVRDAMNSGQALLMLDGLDEVPGDKRETVRNAVTATMRVYPCRVLITCRILSYANTEWQIPETEAVTLAPFDEDKIIQFVEAWYTASAALGNIARDQAQARINDLTSAVRDRRLQDMASNPMLLTVMAIVHNHRGALPRETARLYQECVEILMWKWKPDAARHLREELELDDESDLYRILWQIAYEAHEHQGGHDEAADIPKSDVMAIAAEDHLEGDYAKAQRFCDYVEERAGLLVGRGGVDRQRHMYAFPHRTFQEFLAGCHIADHVDFVEIIGEKAGLGASWREVVLLATGHMVFNKTDRNQPIAAAQYILTPEPTTEEDWQAVWLTGEMLLLIGRQTVEKHRIGVQVLELARARLADLVTNGHLEPVERAAAGRTLSQLGDPRPGLDLNENGVPDVVWSGQVEAGPFQMGGDSAAYNAWDGAEFNLKYDYWIAHYPVTYAQYAAFVAAGGYQERAYWTDAGWEDKGDRTEPHLWNDPEWHIA
ncbi:MAG: DUF4062 domain-containing protein, partial [Chloroflexi bacterium]|nr:DUF4062 domain-containing protein [Chloroflexota bacterium]